jgi:predicted Ser/Thr protein kinase
VNGEAGQARFPPLSQASAERASGSEVLPEIEGYQILEELPRGGQAVVYKAIRRSTGERVALKVLPGAQVSSAAARRQFEREVELAQSLHHPNIVAILDSGLAQGQYYFAMEYIRGLTLDRYRETRPLSLTEGMRLFSMICDAVTGAHQRGVMHRDLKPSNILIDDQGQPHVVDFGLAKATGPLGWDPRDAAAPTLTGQIKGTLAYMAPEQAVGPPERVDVRADVYSLGVILYESVLGRLPYATSGTALELLDAIRSAEPVRPRQVLSRLDRDVEAILLKDLAKDPAQRYQSAAELRYDVDCWLKGLPIVARSVSTLYLLKKVMLRHRYAATVLGLVALTVLGFSVFSYHLYGVWRQAEARTAQVTGQLAAQTRLRSSLTQQALLLHVLDLWQAGRDQEAGFTGQALAAGTPERLAADLVLDGRPWPGKMEQARSMLPLPSRAFILGFLDGEHLLKEGLRSEARQAFQACLSTAGQEGEELLRMRVRMRLLELEGQRP